MPKAASCARLQPSSQVRGHADKEAAPGLSPWGNLAGLDELGGAGVPMELPCGLGPLLRASMGLPEEPKVTLGGGIAPCDAKTVGCTIRLGLDWARASQQELRDVLLHEAAHLAQQRQGGASRPTAEVEREADAAAQAAATGRPVQLGGDRPGAVRHWSGPAPSRAPSTPPKTVPGTDPKTLLQTYTNWGGLNVQEGPLANSLAALLRSSPAHASTVNGVFDLLSASNRKEVASLMLATLTEANLGALAASPVSRPFLGALQGHVGGASSEGQRIAKALATPVAQTPAPSRAGPAKEAGAASTPPDVGPVTFEELVPHRIDFKRAIKKNRANLAKVGYQVFATRLKTVLPTLLRGRFAKDLEVRKRLKLLAELGAPVASDEKLAKLIALWQQASGGTVDGWVGDRSIGTVASQETTQRRDQDAAQQTAAGDRSLQILVDVSTSKELKERVQQLLVMQRRMTTLASTTGRRANQELRGGKNLSKTHGEYSRYKELSEQDRAGIRQFIADTRALLDRLTASGVGLTEAQVAEVKRLFYARLNDLAPYWTQMAAGREIDAIFPKGRVQWKITCHYHALAMALEGMGKSAKDFNGSWDALAMIGEKIDPKRLGTPDQLKALRLPELLMLVSVLYHAGDDPDRATVAVRKASYSFWWPFIARYFGCKAKGVKPPRRDKASLLRELRPKLDQGYQVTVQKIPSHWVRLQGLDEQGVVFDDPWTGGKNWRLTWAEALQKNYFVSYAWIREQTDYEQLVGSFDAARAQKLTRKYMSRYVVTAPELATTLRDRIAASIARDVEKRDYQRLLQGIGTPIQVDEKLVQLIGIWQKLQGGRVDGWIHRGFEKLGFKRKKGRH